MWLVFRLLSFSVSFIPVDASLRNTAFVSREIVLITTTWFTELCSHSVCRGTDVREPVLQLHRLRVALLQHVWDGLLLRPCRYCTCPKRKLVFQTHGKHMANTYWWSSYISCFQQSAARRGMNDVLTFHPRGGICGKCGKERTTLSDLGLEFSAKVPQKYWHLTLQFLT